MGAAKRVLYLTYVALGGLALTIQAQTNITSKLCVDPSGFDSCNSKAKTEGEKCVSACVGETVCILGCGCAYYQALFNCMGQSCWNQVYSCQYQLFVEQYFLQCPVAAEPIPFWPAPDNAPGGCSCNLGKILQHAFKATVEETTCLDKATGVVDIGNLGEVASSSTGCACCAVSAGLSAIYETCPKTIPSKAGADLWLRYSTLYGTTLNWDSCSNVLKSFNCMKDLGFSAPSDKSNEFYLPDNIPKNGTETLYNTGGSVTAPPSGKVFTWHQSTASFTVTAASYNGKNVQATGATGVAVTGSAAATGGNGGTGTSAPGSVGAESTGSSGTSKLGLHVWMIFGISSLGLWSVL